MLKRLDALSELIVLALFRKKDFFSLSRVNICARLFIIVADAVNSKRCINFTSLSRLSSTSFIRRAFKKKAALPTLCVCAQLRDCNKPTMMEEM